ncbi:MAG: glycosyltransferase family 9 protein [Sedimentisphaerales bacterium]|nr:glycosyltransferase family 9 protein [Sedimentisphaerales bacterium]
MAQSKYTNILIIKPSALGDVALSLPAVSAVRKSFPDAKITWLIRPEFAPLPQRTPNVDSLLLFDRQYLGKWWRHPGSLAALGRLFHRLRASRFDLVIDLQGLFRTALFAWSTGSSRRLGLSSAREFATWFYTERIGPHPESAHVIDDYLHVVRATGGQPQSVEYGLSATEQDHEETARILAAHGVPSPSYAVLVIGSAHAVKCWPHASFAELAERIGKRGLRLVAIGTEGERASIESLRRMSAAPIVNLAGQTPIGPLVALLEKASIVISNDTGPGHIAVAVNTPTVMIFGPTNPRRVGPYGKMDVCAAIDPQERGRVVNDYRPQYRIENVSVDLVFEKVLQQLDTKDRANP